MERRNVLKAGTAALAAQISSPGMRAQQAHPKVAMTTSVMLWTLKGTFEEKLEAAARAGIQSVELVAEHVNWTDQDIARIKKLAQSLKLAMDTIIATPDWGKRRVSMVDPAEREAFLADVKQSITFAQKLGIPQIILMSGNEIAGRTHAEQYSSLLEGTKRAGDLASKGGVTLIVEPLNSLVNHKGFFLNNCVEGLKLVKEVDNPHVKLLFDLYHEQVQLGNVTRTAVAAAPWVAVYHVADNPGRNDPGTGEMNYANIYKAIQKTGYKGYMTMEYLPLGDQVASLTKAVGEFRATVAA
ncbi:MAG: hypothetical protein EXQ52_12350 [Bryobacterales bacterium]|nr:hypothetical protein [Bryobacterales bacterium]